MEQKSLALALLKGGNWGPYEALTEAFLPTRYGELLTEAMEALNWDALYLSHVHGFGHIERTMIHGAMCAWAEELPEAETRLLLQMCSYHDTGRTSDFLDGAHGARSAEKLASLTGLAGEDLKAAMAGVEAHSLNDRMMDEVLDRYAPADRPRALLLAEMLKDADGLDRVRIRDLNVKFLRRKDSASRAGFAQELFDRYVAAEAAQGRTLEDGGFDLDTIQKVKAFVADCFGRGASCAQTGMMALGMLTGTEISSQLLDACTGETDVCGLLHAALLFFGIWYGNQGRSGAEITALRRKYRAKFAAQYGSELCREMKPQVGCSGFAVDGILFAIQFFEEENKNKNKTENGVGKS